MKRIAGILAMGLLCACAPAYAADRWLSVEGAGLRDGAGPSNACAARDAQACWGRTGPGDTMYVMAGEYSVEHGSFWRLKIRPSDHGSGISGESKKLTGLGDVRILGPRPVPYDPQMQSRGGAWIEFLRGASHVSVRNFRVSRVSEGILARQGGNIGLRLEDLRFEDTRQNVVLYGSDKCTSRSSCPAAEVLSRDIRIRNVTGVRYSKRHVRLSAGIRDVRVTDSRADGVFLDGDFAVGFDVEGPSENILFRNCEARRNIYTLTPFWNGDGFKSEAETRGIRWIGCSASDNGDAGFDIKTERAYLRDITAAGNGRNIRIWSLEPSRLKNVTAVRSHRRGGMGSDAGIWTIGSLDCDGCALRDNGVQLHVETGAVQGRVRLYDSVLSTDTDRESELVRTEPFARIEFIRTEFWRDGVRTSGPPLKRRRSS